jgi:two-component system, OmpR family, sensor kinase
VSLRARLIAAFAYALIVVIVALEVPLGSNLDKRVNSEVEATSAGQAGIVAATAATQLRDPRELARTSRLAASQLGGSVTIVDGHGRLLATSAGAISPGSVVATTNRPELLAALSGRAAHDRRGSDDAESLNTAVPIVHDGRTVGAVDLAQGVDQVNRTVSHDIWALIGVGVLALALGLGVAWILAGSIARPLRSLGEAARRRAHGDVTARAREAGSREQVEVAREFKEMADRLDAVLESQRAFVADASHQLRTPLTGLRLRLEAAGLKTSDPAVTRELEAAELETERLDHLVADLLELASSEQPAAEESAELAEAARDAVERWRAPAAEGNHELVLRDDWEALVRAAPRELAAILDNLVENAIKYSPDGTPVTIECSGEDGFARVGVISRSGPLDDEVSSRAFERFYRGNGRAGGGTGLGLAIVAALARRRGGAAHLSAIDGSDVRAEVVLPVVDFANS